MHVRKDVALMPASSVLTFHTSDDTGPLGGFFGMKIHFDRFFVDDNPPHRIQAFS